MSDLLKQMMQKKKGSPFLPTEELEKDKNPM